MTTNCKQQATPLFADWNSVNTRALKTQDIEHYIDYWHNPKNTFLDVMGIDRNLLPGRKKMHEQLSLNIESGSTSGSTLVVEFKGNAVGIHELTELIAGESAVMHAHLWRKRDRKKGIGSISYLKAMGVYFDQFNLRQIEFNTPVENIAANKLKQKIGVKLQGRCYYNLPIFKAPIEANHYVCTLKDYRSTLSTLGVSKHGQ